MCIDTPRFLSNIQTGGGGEEATEAKLNTVHRKLCFFYFRLHRSPHPPLVLSFALAFLSGLSGLLSYRFFGPAVPLLVGFLLVLFIVFFSCICVTLNSIDVGYPLC